MSSLFAQPASFSQPILFSELAVDRPTSPILVSRGQYRPCHIRLPGETERLAAILIDGEYYSFFRVIKDRQKTLELCHRLSLKGNRSAITVTPHGDVVWVIEPDAYPALPRRGRSQRQSPTAGLATCKVFESRSQYQIHHIRLSGQTTQLAVVLVDGQYYGLYKLVKSRQEALELAARLNREGEATVITKVSHGDAVWILEPDADLFLN